MDISVIICTYNRIHELKKTLESFRTVECPAGLQWELVIVDNNSSDDTAQLCRQFSEVLPISYVFESRQGKSCALNRGVQEAKGQLYAFTDDDVDVGPQWLSELSLASLEHPEARVFGGKITPRWACSPPKWLSAHSDGMLRALSVCYDRGIEPHFLRDDEPLFYGANMALRREVFEEGVRFREDLGPNGRGAVRGEEIEMLQELLRRGYRGFYVPAALVYHRNPKERMTERYLRCWYKGAGMEAVRRGHYEDTKRKWLGAPGYLWRQFVLHARIYLVTRYTCPSHIWLPSEITMMKSWGAICEFRRHHGVSAWLSRKV